jgi:predicted RNA-binding protein YlqC (UPF0109 family)
LAAKRSAGYRHREKADAKGWHIAANFSHGGERMKELVERMAKALVDKPEDVVVNEIDGEKTTVYELKVASTDLGKVIGKQGKTARAMRTILSASGTKIGKRCVLEILE